MVKGYSSDFIGNELKTDKPICSLELEGTVYQNLQSKFLEPLIFFKKVN